MVIGGGLAGMTAALRLAGRVPVVIVTKAALGEGSTQWAQGGIAAAVGPGDSVEGHVRDTLEAGAGMGDRGTARAVCGDAPGLIAELEGLGVRFDRAGDALALAREGAHSLPRVVHAGGDETGRHVAAALAGLSPAEEAAWDPLGGQGPLAPPPAAGQEAVAPVEGGGGPVAQGEPRAMVPDGLGDAALCPGAADGDRGSKVRTLDALRSE